MTTPRSAVYTCNFGGYDISRKQPARRDLAYICFTDDPKLDAPGWSARVVDLAGSHPTLAARDFKARPHVHLRDFDRSLYIDATITLRDEGFVEALHLSSPAVQLGLVRHPAFDDVYQESERCIRYGKADPDALAAQAAAYRAAGYPEGHGLYIGGCLVRAHHAPEVQKFGENWWEQIQNYTCRDQLSLNFLLWREGPNFTEIDQLQYIGERDRDFEAAHFSVGWHRAALQRTVFPTA